MLSSTHLSMNLGEMLQAKYLLKPQKKKKKTH